VTKSDINRPWFCFSCASETWSSMTMSLYGMKEGRKERNDKIGEFKLRIKVNVRDVQYPSNLIWWKLNFSLLAAMHISLSCAGSHIFLIVTSNLLSKIWCLILTDLVLQLPHNVVVYLWPWCHATVQAIDLYLWKGISSSTDVKAKRGLTLSVLSGHLPEE